MESLHSFLRTHLTLKPAVESRNVGCFLKQIIHPRPWLTTQDQSQTPPWNKVDTFELPNLKTEMQVPKQDSPCTDPPPHLPSGKIGKISMIFWLLASPAALPLSYRRLVEAKAILTLTKKSGLSLTHRCGKILATFSNKTYAYPLPRPNSKTSLQFLNMILKSLRPQ